MKEWLFLLAGGLLGGAVVWLLGLRTSERLKASEARLGEALSDLEASREESRSQAVRIGSLEATLSEERKGTEEKIGLLNQAREALLESFKALSGEALKSNNQAFLELAKTSLDTYQKTAQSDLELRQKAVEEMVKPVKESLEKVGVRLGELEVARVSAYSQLGEQIRTLMEVQIPQLHRETSSLVNALKQPSVRGRWGEIQLKRVVEMAGMQEYCDFDEQESVSVEGGRQRPDLIVKLPGGKQIVVDAKTPLDAYLDALETGDDVQRKALLQKHARQMRDHMEDLGRKAYWDNLAFTPEFVVLFIPGEVFFSVALQEDRELIEFGVERRVILASPTTLIALLKTVAYGWRQEAIARNAREVSDLGRELYGRIVKLAGHWKDMGRHLTQTVEAYNRSVGNLESRVLVQARRFKELKSAPDNETIPELTGSEGVARGFSAPELMEPDEPSDAP
jgi:DNA recombination protein RmuC